MGYTSFIPVIYRSQRFDLPTEQVEDYIEIIKKCKIEHPQIYDAAIRGTKGLLDGYFNLRNESELDNKLFIRELIVWYANEIVERE